MHIEYSYYDSSSNEIETKEIISKVIKYPVNTIAVLPTYLRSVKTIIPSNIELCCPIDYPLGIIDNKSRISILEGLLKMVQRVWIWFVLHIFYAIGNMTSLEKR